MSPNDSEDVGTVRKRVFVGNLPTEITLSEFLKLIPLGCEVTNIEVKQKNNIDGDPSTSFAFLTVNGALNSIKSWCHSFSKKSFKGHKVTVEFAKESFLDRLQKELKKAKHKAENFHVCHSPCKQFLESGITISEPKKSKRHKKAELIEPQAFSEQLEIEPPDLPMIVSSDINYDAEARRKKSLAERSSLYLNQVKAIKESLGAARKVNNKIVFNEDIEEVIPEEMPIMNEETSLTNSNNFKKPNLFDSCDESDNDEKYDFSATKPSYKIVETKYSTFDERFRLDKRFLEESDKVPVVNNEEENEDNDEDRTINNIISSIIGESSAKKKKHIHNNDNDKLPARFNPMITEHKQYLVPLEEPPNDAPDILKEKEKGDTFKVSSDQFYHISDGLSQTFKKEEDKNEFSLLGIFGDNSITENTSKNEEKSINIVGKQFFHVTNEMEDSSGDEDGQILENNAGEAVKEPQGPSENTESFFFHKDDERLKASLQFFKEPLKSTESYSVRRNKIKKIISTKYKKNIRRVSSFSVKLGGNKRKKIGQKRMVPKKRNK